MKNLPVLFLFILIMTSVYADEPVKIMPVGNSITAGEHYRVPALEERTGYRKDLYWMLINSGYNVDFVGSQQHGTRPESDPDWYDWNNEAYPGWKIPDIAAQVKQYLPKYKPDILLVHIGTNGSDWSSKPGQVMDLLDMVDKFSTENNHSVTVVLCKIINRYYKESQTETTQFNNEVADLVAARTGDKIKIVITDMEKGAGLDYTDNPPDSTATPPYEGGDMWGTKYPGVSYDKYHPNDKGNTKMAVKFYEELVNILGEPTGINNPGLDQLQLNQYKLYPNYPNPFNPSTSIKYLLSKQTHVKLSVFDINGRFINTLVNTIASPGIYEIHWNAEQLASGTYCLILNAGDYCETRKCLLYK